jgi:hypothetical protein
MGPMVTVKGRCCEEGEEKTGGGGGGICKISQLCIYQHKG